MNLGETKIVVEFSLEERDQLCEYFLHEMCPDSSGKTTMPDEIYHLLKQLGMMLAPDWC